MLKNKSLKPKGEVYPFPSGRGLVLSCPDFWCFEGGHSDFACLADTGRRSPSSSPRTPYLLTLYILSSKRKIYVVEKERTCKSSVQGILEGKSLKNVSGGMVIEKTMQKRGRIAKSFFST